MNDTPPPLSDKATQKIWSLKTANYSDEGQKP
jgi:hypothetical protein